MPVYFVQSGEGGPVKIGWTASQYAPDRISFLQTGNPVELRLIRIVEGGRATERWLHEHFAALRIRGEWFSFAAEMLTIEPAAVAERRKRPVKITTGAMQWEWLAPFFARIDRFLLDTGMSGRELGLRAVRDGKVIANLRAGRGTTRMLDCIEAFIARWENCDAPPPA